MEVDVACVAALVVFVHNMPVRFVNQLKSKGLSRSHPVHMATAAVVTHQQIEKKKKKLKREKVKLKSSGGE